MGNYALAEDVAADVGITDPTSYASVDAAIDAAEAQIDVYCGRRFWQDSAVVIREFYGCGNEVDLLDQPGDVAVEISTTTGLIVKTDTGGDGSFATTLTINTNFLLLPRNAAADSRPYSCLTYLDNYWPTPSNGRAGVQITAKFGWATIPEQVKRAARIQAVLLWKSKDTPFGAAQLGDTAVLFQRAAIHPTARELLAGFRTHLVG
jgi:hypothetical protein